MKSYQRNLVQDPALSRQIEFIRYLSNGLLSTIVHYFVLTVGMEVIGFKLASVANLIGAIFGITTSFLGNRYFVFRNHTEGFVQQAIRFSMLYAAIATLHITALLIWSDWMKLDYRAGFLAATGLQVGLSYLGNRYLVFRK